MNRTLVLDTNALIRLFKGTSREIEKALMGCSKLVIPLAVYGEFLVGVSKGKTARAELDLFQSLISTPNTEVHRPTETTAQFFAKIVNQLQKQGTPIPTNDIWIAAETMEIGGTLYSYDRHFSEVPLLNLVLCEDEF